MNYKSVIIAIIATLCMISCSPQRRLANICDKHPELCSMDTTYVDTLISSRVVFDSTFTLSSRDTFLYENMGVTTKIIRNYDSFYVYSHKTDTQYVVNKEKVITVDRSLWWHKWAAIAFVIVSGFWLASKMFDKIFQ